jgi:hypothetical protein
MGFRIPIKTSSSPAIHNLITLNVAINHSIIKTSNLKVYIISPANSQTTTPIIVRQGAINREKFSETVTKRIGFC